MARRGQLNSPPSVSGGVIRAKYDCLASQGGAVAKGSVRAKARQSDSLLRKAQEAALPKAPLESRYRCSPQGENRRAKRGRFACESAS